MRKRSHQHGFTVVEMLTASAVAGLLLIGVMTFVTNTLVNNSVASARSDLLREAQLALDTIARDARLSANVDVLNRWEDENSPDAVATNGFGWEADADTLILATAALNADGDILFQDPTNYLTYKDNAIYFVDNGTLYKRTLAADVANNNAVNSCPETVASPTCPVDRVLVNNVSSYTIRYLNNQDAEVLPGQARSIEVSIGLTKQKYNQTLTANYTTRTVFRNE